MGVGQITVLYRIPQGFWETVLVQNLLGILEEELMKKILLSTTALIAMGLVTAAHAAEKDQPIKLTVGGAFQFGYGIMLQDNNQPGQAGFKRAADSAQEDFLIRISGESKFENGLTAGVYFRLRGENTRGGGAAFTNDTFKDDYLYLKGDAFGTFRFGDVSDVRRDKGYTAPQVCNCGDSFFGSNTQNVTFNNSPIGTNATAANFDGRATKIAYYSPTINGFQLAFSYAPDFQKGHRVGGNRAEAFPNGGGNTGNLNLNFARNFYSVAASYDAAIGDVKISTGAGFSGASAVRATTVVGINDADPFIYNAGLTVTYGAFKIGGAYEYSAHGEFGGFTSFGAAGLATAAGGAFAKVKTNDINNKISDIGITYTVGPLTTGISYSRGDYEGVVDPANPKRSAINNIVFAGANYLVGPGVNLLGGVQLNNYDPQGNYVPLPKNSTPSTIGSNTGGTGTAGVPANNNPFARSYTGVVLVFGTAIRF